MEDEIVTHKSRTKRGQTLKAEIKYSEGFTGTVTDCEVTVDLGDSVVTFSVDDEHRAISLYNMLKNVSVEVNYP